MLCGFTCLVLNCALHCKIDFFRIGLFVKIEEPAMLGINMFSAPSLTLKSSMITLLYWAVIQAVGFIIFQVKPFWFGWRSVDIRPIDFALLAHLTFLEHLAHSNRWLKGTAYTFVFAKACPYLPVAITIVQIFMTVRCNQISPNRSVRALLSA